MRSADEILLAVRTAWAAHPDDYDPDDAQMLALIRLVQADALAHPVAPESMPIADALDGVEVDPPTGQAMYKANRGPA